MQMVKEKVELVKPEYQPSNEEQEEDMRVELDFEELAQAVLTPVKVEQSEKPKEGHGE